MSMIFIITCILIIVMFIMIEIHSIEFINVAINYFNNVFIDTMFFLNHSNLIGLVIVDSVKYLCYLSNFVLFFIIVSNNLMIIITEFVIVLFIYLICLFIILIYCFITIPAIILIYIHSIYSHSIITVFSLNYFLLLTYSILFLFVIIV